jgi:hypothetical protein
MTAIGIQTFAKIRGNANKYRAAGQPIHLIGIAFSPGRCTLVGFEVETL